MTQAIVLYQLPRLSSALTSGTEKKPLDQSNQALAAQNKIYLTVSVLYKH